MAISNFAITYLKKKVCSRMEVSISGNSIAPATIESNLVNGEPPQMAIVPPNADRDCDPNKTEDEDDLDTLHCEETMRVEDEMDETEDEDFSTAPESDSVRKPEISNSKIFRLAESDVCLIMLTSLVQRK